MPSAVMYENSGTIISVSQWLFIINIDINCIITVHFHQLLSQPPGTSHLSRLASHSAAHIHVELHSVGDSAL